MTFYLLGCGKYYLETLKINKKIKIFLDNWLFFYIIIGRDMKYIFTTDSGSELETRPSKKNRMRKSIRPKASGTPLRKPFFILITF